MVQTARLTLRTWRESDIDPFTAICRDPVVMELFPKLPTRDEVAAQLERINAKIASDGFGFWAVEHAGELPPAGGRSGAKPAGVIGVCGISRVGFDAHFTPAVEIGWRLARSGRLRSSGDCRRDDLCRRSRQPAPRTVQACQGKTPHRMTAMRQKADAVEQDLSSRSQHRDLKPDIGGPDRPPTMAPLLASVTDLTYSTAEVS